MKKYINVHSIPTASKKHKHFSTAVQCSYSPISKPLRFLGLMLLVGLGNTFSVLASQKSRTSKPAKVVAPKSESGTSNKKDMLKKKKSILFTSLNIIWNTLVLTPLIILAVLFIENILNQVLKLNEKKLINERRDYQVDEADTERHSKFFLSVPVDKNLEYGNGLEQLIFTIYSLASLPNAQGVMMTIKPIEGSNETVGAHFATFYALEQALSTFKKEPKKQIVAFCEEFQSQTYFLASVADFIGTRRNGTMLLPQDIVYPLTTYFLGANIVSKQNTEVDTSENNFIGNEDNTYFAGKNKRPGRTYSHLVKIWLHHYLSIFKKEVTANRKAIVAKTKFTMDWKTNFWNNFYTLPCDSCLTNAPQTRITTEQAEHMGLIDCFANNKTDLIAAMANKIKKTVEISNFNYINNKSASGIDVVFLMGKVCSTMVNNTNNRLIALAHCKKSAGVILVIDSLGGFAKDCDKISAIIVTIKKKKPIFAYVHSHCCSAAYYIASSCNYIISAKNGVIGSIGVRVENVLPDQIEETKQILKKHYDQMITTIAENRSKVLNTSVQDIEKVLIDTQAAIYSADTAHNMELIDQIASLNDSINHLRQAAGLNPSNLNVFFHPRNPINSGFLTPLWSRFVLSIQHYIEQSHTENS